MTTHTIEISCTGPTPAATTVSNGDKVTFNNTTGASVTISLASPSIFNPSPSSTIQIDEDDSDTFTVGNIRSGSGFEYPDCGEALGTRGGTIDP